MADPKDPLYIGIAHQAAVRRDVLISQMSMIKCLKGYETFKEARKRKIEAMSQLHAILEEAHSIVKKFRLTLPKTDMKAGPVPTTKPVAQKKSVKQMHLPKKSSKKIPITKQKDTLTLLEKELSDIEHKLDRLS